MGTLNLEFDVAEHNHHTRTACYKTAGWRKFEQKCTETILICVSSRHFSAGFKVLWHCYQEINYNSLWNLLFFVGFTEGSTSVLSSVACVILNQLHLKFYMLTQVLVLNFQTMAYTSKYNLPDDSLTWEILIRRHASVRRSLHAKSFREQVCDKGCFTELDSLSSTCLSSTHTFFFCSQ